MSSVQRCLGTMPQSHTCEHCAEWPCAGAGPRRQPAHRLHAGRGGSAVLGQRDEQGELGVGTEVGPRRAWCENVSSQQPPAYLAAWLTGCSHVSEATPEVWSLMVTACQRLAEWEVREVHISRETLSAKALLVPRTALGYTTLAPPGCC